MLGLAVPTVSKGSVHTGWFGVGPEHHGADHFLAEQEAESREKLGDGSSWVFTRSSAWIPASMEEAVCGNPGLSS